MCVAKYSKLAKQVRTRIQQEPRPKKDWKKQVNGANHEISIYTRKSNSGFGHAAKKGRETAKKET